MKKEKKKTPTEERNNRVVPVARELLQLLASCEDLPMGATTTEDGKGIEDIAEKAGKLYSEIVVPLILEKDLKLNDVSYLFSIMQQGIHLVSEIADNSLQLNRDQADAKKYGLENIDELSIRDLDNILKEEGVDNSKKK